MTAPARVVAPRTPVFNAVTAGLLLLSVLWVLLLVATPQGPVEMMVPWLRPVNLMQALLGGACVTLMWYRQGWAFYVWVGVILLGLLIGLLLRYAIPFLAIGPVLLVLYLWALHTGGNASMWRQMFGAPGLPGRPMAYGAPPPMPPPVAGARRPPMPPAPPAAAAMPRTSPTPPLPPAAPRAPAPPSAPLPPAPLPAAARPAAIDPIEALKRLGALRERGAITEAEFAAKKAELLQRL